MVADDERDPVVARSPARRGSRNRWRGQVVLGFLFSAVFLWLAFRDVDIAFLLGKARAFPTHTIVLCFVGQLAVQVMHWSRWGLFVRRIGRMPWRRVWSVAAVGNAALYLMPGRLGEIVRPGLAVMDAEIDPAGAVATSVVERVWDALAVGLLLLAAAPAYLEDGSTAMWVRPTFALLSLFLAFALGSFLAARHETWIHAKVRAGVGRFSEPLAARLSTSVGRFLAALRVFMAWDLLIPYAFLTAGVWIMEAISLAWLLPVVSAQGGLRAGFHAIAILAIANLVPAGPARLGLFEFAIAVGLQPFAIIWSDGVLVGTVFHIVALGVVLAGGLMGLWWGGIGFGRFLSRRRPG